jgi:hypothetical protein
MKTVAREPYFDSIFLSGVISPMVRSLLAEALAARDVARSAPSPT